MIDLQKNLNEIFQHSNVTELKQLIEITKTRIENIENGILSKELDNGSLENIGKLIVNCG